MKMKVKLEMHRNHSYVYLFFCTKIVMVSGGPFKIGPFLNGTIPP